MLGALAILGAVGFLVLVMVQAMGYFRPPEPPKPRPHLLGPATKAAPVVHPPPLVDPEPPEKPPLHLLPATKAGILGPLKISPPAPAPQPQVTPPPRH